MAWTHLDWEGEDDLQVTRFCGNPDGDHDGDDWPRVVILHLSAEEFLLFDQDPVEYARENDLFPEQPIRWMSGCAKPPVGDGIPQAAEGTSWTVIINHGKPSLATSAAIPDEVDS